MRATCGRSARTTWWSILGDPFHSRADVGKVDVALEAVGVSTFNATLRSLRSAVAWWWWSEIVPEKVALNLGYVMTYGLSIIGGSGATRAEMAAVLALHAEKPFRIAIDRVLPLSRADEAQRAVRAGGLEGRVVVVPG